MRYAVVKLTNDQFRRHMRRGGLMILGEDQVNSLYILDVDDLRALNLWQQARELADELAQEREAKP